MEFIKRKPRQLAVGKNKNSQKAIFDINYFNQNNS